MITKHNILMIESYALYINSNHVIVWRQGFNTKLAIWLSHIIFGEITKAKTRV